MKLDKFNKRQALVAVAVFLATVATLFGGQALNAKFRVDNPLQNKVKAIRGVERVQLAEAGNGIKVKLRLSRVADLQRVLEPVREIVERYRNQPVTAFEIEDRSNRALREARYQLSFYLEEAAVSGHYIELKEKLDSFDKVSARVYLGSKFVYVQLEQGGHYLYQAVPRPARSLAEPGGPGGGSA
jgi:hypothetical protein